ncbi:hypothetical protein [Leucobacter salsicius]|nr:hypothetical protein [Leucobacter salsicius]
MLENDPGPDLITNGLCPTCQQGTLVWWEAWWECSKCNEAMFPGIAT